jgi:hypothetical protein
VGAETTRGQSPGSRPRASAAAPFRYAWGNNAKRADLKGRACEVLAGGALGSLLVRFEDGRREVISRRALRRA